MTPLGLNVPREVPFASVLLSPIAVGFGKLLQNTSLTLMGFIQVGRVEEDFANFFSEHFLGFGTFFLKVNFWVHCLFPTHVDVECHPSTI